MSSSPPPTGYTSEDEDLECPLCMEEIDITDKYFKPCPCGYQICRFCWNHIKEDLNGLCPACRRPFSDESVEFKPVSPEEIVRIKNAKKRREKEKKEMDNAARRHLANARVVQKNLIYILGLPPKYCTEEILRSNEFFGQYGKISRVIINRRGHGHTPVISALSPTGVYVTYLKKEDALRAIEAVDGTVYDGRVIRVTHGTTKYCSYFLKNQVCQNPNCQYLHEPAEEADTYAKEEVGRQLVRDRQPRPVPFASLLSHFKKEEKEESALPPTANWAKQVGKQPTPAAIGNPSAQAAIQAAAAAAAAAVSATAPASSSTSEPDQSATATDGDKLGDGDAERAEKKAERSERKKAKKAAAAAAAAAATGGQIVTLPTGGRGSISAEKPSKNEDEDLLLSGALYDSSDEVVPMVTRKGRLLEPVALAKAFGAAAVTAAAAAAAVASSSSSVPIPLSLGSLGDEFLSPSVLGYNNHPVYLGPFDPFGNDDFANYLNSSRQNSSSSFDNALGSASNSGPSGQMYRLDSFTENRTQRVSPQNELASVRTMRPRGGEIDGGFEGDLDKLEEERKNVQSFRTLFPNVNVSFASVGLSEAEARWGEGFSPSKLATHPEASVGQWVQQQQREQLESALRAHQQSQQQQQQQQFGSFAGGPRAATANHGLNVNQFNLMANRQDLRNQDFIQQQQLLTLQQQQQQQQQQQGVAPQLYGRFPQQSQLQAQQQQQQSMLMQQQFGLGSHNLSQSLTSAQAQNEEFLGAFMREAQIRESNIQLRDLQVRERAHAAAAAAAAARGESLGFRESHLAGKAGLNAGAEGLGMDRSALLAARLRPFETAMSQQGLMQQGQYGGPGLHGDWPQAGANSLAYGDNQAISRAEAIAQLREREAQREQLSAQQLHLAQLQRAEGLAQASHLQDRERELLSQVRDAREWELLARMQAAGGSLGMQPQLQQLPGQQLAQGQGSPGQRAVLQAQGRRRI
ncbi:transcriptional repressor general negative regulator of transcription subunit 4 [Phlyctochytrium planicorne]|nr:transcriptional repressor general negative regulator of transcription subunit 4 [Phlyctochytrium planicorne]